MKGFTDELFSGKALSACMNAVNRALSDLVQGFVIESVEVSNNNSRVGRYLKGATKNDYPQVSSGNNVARLTFHFFTNTMVFVDDSENLNRDCIENVNRDKILMKSPRMLGREKVVLEYTENQLALEWRKDYDLEQNLARLFFLNLSTNRPHYPQTWKTPSPYGRRDRI